MPIDPASRNWNASTFKGELIVRASDENKARQIASNEFHIATPQSLGRDVVVSPWKNPDTVSCEKVDGSEYAAESPDGILHRKEISQ